MVTNLLAIQEAWVRSLGSEGALEEDMATHSSTLAWRIPITGDPPHVSVVSGMPPDARSQAAAVLSCSVVSQLFGTPLTADPQAPLSMRILQARIPEKVTMLSSRGSSQPRDRTLVFRIAGEFFTI